MLLREQRLPEVEWAYFRRSGGRLGLPRTAAALAEKADFRVISVSRGNCLFPRDFADPRGNSLGISPGPGKFCRARGNSLAARAMKNRIFAPAELGRLRPIRVDRGHQGLQRGHVCQGGRRPRKKLWAVLSEISAILAKSSGTAHYGNRLGFAKELLGGANLRFRPGKRPPIDLIGSGEVDSLGKPASGCPWRPPGPLHGFRPLQIGWSRDHLFEIFCREIG